MPIVSNYTSSGYTGKFSTTSGDFTLAGDVTTDARQDIVTLTGTVTVTATSKKVGSFSLYFVNDPEAQESAVNTRQSAIDTAIEAVRAAIHNELNPS